MLNEIIMLLICMLLSVRWLFFFNFQTGYFSAIVFEYVDYTDWSQLYNKLNDSEIKYYMYQLMRALKASHELKIIHRDVKPSNLVINSSRKQLRLIDWGCATYHNPGDSHELRVGTCLYRSPEMDLGYSVSLPFYHYLF